MINLAGAVDRRREMAVELGRIGLGFDDPLVQVFPAVRPHGPGRLRVNRGAGVFSQPSWRLKDAVANGCGGILILEDDVTDPAALAKGQGEALLEPDPASAWRAGQ